MTPTDLSYVNEFSALEREERQYSSLDLCQPDAFTLIINSNPAQLPRAAEVAQTLKKKANGLVSIPLRIAILGVDFEVAFPHKAAEWLGQLNVNDGQGGGVLVRPDQHILAVLEDETSAQDIVEYLNQAAGW